MNYLTCYNLKSSDIASIRARHPATQDDVRAVTNKQAIELGFTLIELMVTLLVFAIILTIAIPSFHTIILNNRLNTSSDSVVSALNYARSTALYTNNTVLFCPFNSANSTTCGTNWSTGWIIVTQPAIGTSVLIKSQENSPNGPTITANNNSVTFNSQGSASSQTNFSFCDDRGASFAHSVEIMTTGYIQSGNTPGQAVWNNNAMTCP